MKLRLLVGIVSIHMLATIADAAPFAYVLNRGSGDVTVIDTSVYNAGTPDLAVVRQSLPVGLRPYSIAVAPSGGQFIVANQGNASDHSGSSLAVVDGDTLTISGTLSINYVPGGMAISKDGSRLYVADQTPGVPSLPDISNRVMVYSVTPSGATPLEYLGYLSVKQPGSEGISITMPEGVALDETAKRLFVANSANDRIAVFNLDKLNDDLINSAFESPTSRLADIQLAAGSRPTGIAVAQGKLFVANTNTNNVSVFATADSSLSATYTSGSSPYGVTASADGSKVYVANASDNFDRVLVINVTAGTSSLVNTAHDNQTYACSAAEAAGTGGRYFVTNVPADEISGPNTNVTAVNPGTGAILISANKNPCSFGNFIGPNFTYAITTGVTGNGTITPSKTEGAPNNTVLANEGAVKNFKFLGNTPGTDCVTDVKLDSVSIGKPTERSIGPISKNYTLDVTFGTCSGYTLKAILTGSGNCSVTSNPAGINILSPATEGSANFTPGDIVLTASAAEGSRFLSWTGCDSVNGTECTVNLTGNKIAYAACDLASLSSNDVKRGSKYYDTIGQAVSDTTNSTTLIQAIGVPTKTVAPVTCSTTQSVKLEGKYNDASFAGRGATLTPVGTVTISGGCTIEFDGIAIK